ncbi:hypothetical protein SKAU_G00375320 [Synaphobranchus kaupii]|uniref:Secreted protein n=1 Tax=Synaphobranchus kaupii TaxID=118154 RepID=A0A9Q1IGC9_SYNKA|nr:hypothetical protein SKAU_G00375320 [Synaphobranchus kaupii]
MTSFVFFSSAAWRWFAHCLTNGPRPLATRERDYSSQGPGRCLYLGPKQEAPLDQIPPTGDGWLMTTMPMKVLQSMK